MDTSRYLFDGTKRYTANAVKPDDTHGLGCKDEGLALLETQKQQIEQRQAALFAEGTRSLLVVFQAMDAAGKDGTISKVFSGVNPQGVQVANFKQPSANELAHDYLWRIHREVPLRGRIGVFNRSHYEEVLVAKVENLPKTQALPPEARKDVWNKRYRQIREFEQYLTENGVHILKFFLHVSKQEQARRLLARLDDATKNWKFNAGDLDTRAKWDAYAKAYREAVNQTATPAAPWYVVPADHKWYTHAVVASVIAQTLAGMKPRHPKADEALAADIQRYRAALQAELE